ncbi:helix-turn-helix transcriptional regulator [Ruegeria arenilitoris]|uniref:helix-turn-helix transcriptional regulator n=1 Tax=Ruegeria arenilitoris TaxID=1173585 RepID=UPI00147CDC7E|nr:AlpA family phage regulatory protein [Ruegeria arenilitoris]
MVHERVAHLTLLSFEHLEEIGIKYSREHLRRLEAADQFPKRLRLSPGRVAWRLSEIEDWLESRPVGLE